MEPLNLNPVDYREKSRNFYAAHGYEKSYQWATNQIVPFTPPGISLSEARVGVVTTSYPVAPPGAGRPVKQVYAQASSPTPEAMFTRDLSWDKEATHTDDVGSFLPLDLLGQMVDEGVIGSLSPRFYGVPTSYSQRQTHADAVAIAEMVAQDDVDLVLLVPL